jgi:hypothetical protein
MTKTTLTLIALFMVGLICVLEKMFPGQDK